LSFVAGADDPTNWPRGARVALERYCDAHSISLVNDDKGAHPEILAIYDRAIESLGARS
jgi:hypothetical protein